MTGTTRTSADLDPRRRKALFRAWHRGTREMDLILGGFADLHISELSETEMDEFEALLDQLDPLLLDWVTSIAPTPDEFNTSLFRRIVDHKRHMQF